MEALVVTARQCLACLEVGYLARATTRSATARGSRFAVVAPHGDSARVCRKLKQERVAAPVLLVPDSLVPWRDSQADLLYFRIDSLGAGPAAVATASHGLSMLDSINVLYSRSSPTM